MKKKILIGAIACAVLLAYLGFKSFRGKAQEVRVETTRVVCGDVSNTISATGTIQAIQTVKVGTQVSGEISKIYADYNSHVKAGQLLAELDRKPLTSALSLAKASLDEAKAEIRYQSANYNRIKALFSKKLTAESEYDEALYNYQRAKTTLRTAQLNYDKAKLNLSYAYIYSPIDGVVLDRAVSEGQTVAASFSTPTLFTIAHDLTHMQVEASIDEADIGKVKVGQRVSFTVDAFPDMKFSGEVTQIRLQSVTTSNVVTYTVIIQAPNPQLKLMPGMTANITVYVDECRNVITMSSKALHFKPDAVQIKNYMSNFSDEDKKKMEQYMSNFKTHAAQKRCGGDEESASYEVWVKRGNLICPVTVEVGIDDDMNVQIISGLKEGDEVVTGMSKVSNAESEATEGDTSSPFMPKPPTKKGRG